MADLVFNLTPNLPVVDAPAPPRGRGRPKKKGGPSKHADPDAAPSADDPRPTIKVVQNDMARIIDKSQRALIAAERGIYQRDGLIVWLSKSPERRRPARK